MVNQPPVPGPSLATIVIAVVFWILAAVVVGLRVWARRLKNQKLVLNDWAAIVAVIIDFAFSGVMCAMVIAGGMGQHVYDLIDPQQQAVDLAKLLLVLECLWASSNLCVKISICHLYSQIFSVRSFRIASYVIVGLGVCYFISVVCEALFLCWPIAYNWDKTIPDGHCGDSYSAYLAVGLFNLFTDLFIIILPIPYVWSLQLPIMKKVALSGIFLLGIIICVISTLRVIALATWHQADYLPGLAIVGIYSLLEPTLGLINCSLPLLQPVVSRFSRSKLWTVRDATIRQQYGSNHSRGGGKWYKRQDDYQLSDIGDREEMIHTGTYHNKSSQSGLNEDYEPQTIVRKQSWTVEYAQR